MSSNEIVDKWDEEVDLLVFGGGAGGMTAALSGALRNLNVMLCEKTDMVGGITSTSGGTIWIPGSHLSVEAGVPDTVEAADDYLHAVVGNRDGKSLRKAYLEAGPLVVEELQAKTDVQLVAATAHPDYIGNQPGEAFGGRALAPLPFDGRTLGKEDFNHVRPPRREFMALGGMMVARNGIDALLHPFKSISNFKAATKTLVRYGIDRLSYRRGTQLVMGNALVARLLSSLKKQSVPIYYRTKLEDIIFDGKTVIGAIISGPEGLRRVRTRRGVVLATGGIAHNKKLRDKYYPAPARPYCLAPEDNTGDGVELAAKRGAVIAEEMDSPGLWMPCSRMKRKDGMELMWPHIILDRAKPGLFAVNSDGQRFVNESNSYHDFVMGMLSSQQVTPSVPAYLICDRRFLERYMLGMIFKGAKSLKPYLEAGYIIEAETLEQLAEKIKVNSDNLVKTAEEYNQYAQTGVDKAFGRGTSKMNRFNGDPDNQPNPCMGTIAKSPFYAMAVWPADLASSQGLKGNEHGQLLDGDGQPIEGLYACGNDLNSIFGGTYPGPGTTIGPAMVFGWCIARHAANDVHQQAAATV